MTQLAKLYRKFMEGRPLTFVEFQRLLEAFGFRLDRVTGSHHIYRREGVVDRMTIQPEGKAAKAYQVRALRAMIEAYGLGLDGRQ